MEKAWITEKGLSYRSGVIILKVEDTLSNRSNLIDITQIESRQGIEVKDSDFQGQLQQAEYKNYKGKLDQLAEQIFEQGRKVEKKADVKELIAYKRLISEFLSEFMNNTYKFSKQSSLDRRGRYRVYSTIKKINQELDNLTEDILSSQKDNLKVLQRLDDIRGLILDLLM